jgi:hypothetical protein
VVKDGGEGDCVHLEVVGSVVYRVVKVGTHKAAKSAPSLFEVKVKVKFELLSRDGAHGVDVESAFAVGEQTHQVVRVGLDANASPVIVSLKIVRIAS